VQIRVLQPGQVSDEAAEYLDQALDLMQEYSLKTEMIDWNLLRANSHALVANAQSPADTYPAIRYAISVLDDGHSSFKNPEIVLEKKRNPGQLEQSGEHTAIPTGRHLDDQIALLVIPAIGSLQKDVGLNYVARAHETLRVLDTESTCGWIVDLRENVGGNAGPMIASVAPLLGEGVVGSFHMTNGESGSTIVRHGQALNHDGQIDYPIKDPYQTSHPNAAVAVLIDENTASAGELTAIKFIGRENTRSFGWPTAGKVSGNMGISMPDGAILSIAVGYGSDRLGNSYQTALTPDVLAPKTDGATDEALKMATDWLHAQPVCSS